MTPTPVGKFGHTALQLFARRTRIQLGLALATGSPIKLKPQKAKTLAIGIAEPVKPHNPRFISEIGDGVDQVDLCICPFDDF